LPTLRGGKYFKEGAKRTTRGRWDCRKTLKKISGSKGGGKKKDN